MNIHKIMEVIGWIASGMAVGLGLLYLYVSILADEEDYDLDDCDDSSK